MKAHRPRAKTNGTPQNAQPLRIEVLLNQEAPNIVRGRIPVPVGKYLGGRDGDKLVFSAGSKQTLDEINEPFVIVTIKRRRGRK